MSEAYVYRLLGDVAIRYEPPDIDRTAVHYHQILALSAATDLYRAMDMTFWLPQAETALTEVEG